MLAITAALLPVPQVVLAEHKARELATKAATNADARGAATQLVTHEAAIEVYMDLPLVRALAEATRADFEARFPAQVHIRRVGV